MTLNSASFNAIGFPLKLFAFMCLLNGFWKILFGHSIRGKPEGYLDRSLIYVSISHHRARLHFYCPSGFARSQYSVQSPDARVDVISSALIFASITSGRKRAHRAPCGACSIPPSGPANPCTAPSAAFARANPPKRLANDIPSRACFVRAVLVGTSQ